MFEVHETQEGTRMLIAQMDDDHLLKTIKRYARKIAQCVTLLNGVQVQGSGIIQALRPEFSQESMKAKASDQIRFLDSKIRPYVMEAALRGLEVTEILQAAYQRKEALPSIQELIVPMANDILSLPEGEDDDCPF